MPKLVRDMLEIQARCIDSKPIEFLEKNGYRRVSSSGFVECPYCKMLPVVLISQDNESGVARCGHAGIVVVSENKKIEPVTENGLKFDWANTMSRSGCC